MDVPEGFDPTLTLALNLLGTFVFGLSGGLAAVRARMDLVGVLVLAATVGIAGGIIRDLLIGVPPATFRDSRYLAAVGLAGVACFFARNRLQQRRVHRTVLVFDALGLGLFAVTGTTKALAYGLGPVQAVILGVITGVGGGLVRDLLVGDVPSVLRQDLYAVPALLGAGFPVAAELLGSSSPLFPLAGVLVCVLTRIVGVRYKLQLPSEPPRPRRPRASRSPDRPTDDQ